MHSLSPVDGEINEKAREMLQGFLSCPHKDISPVGDVCEGGGGDRQNISLYGARNDISN